MIMRTLLASSIWLATLGVASAENELCPGEGKIRSIATDVKTEILFENDTDETVRLSWVDFEGKRVDYGEIQSGANLRQPTFLGQAWLVSDRNADCLAFYFAETEPREVALSGEASASAAIPSPGAPPRASTRPLPRTPSGPQTADEDSPQADSPCDEGEYWNRSRNICIDTTTRKRRPAPRSDFRLQSAPTRATAAAPRTPERTLRCRPGFAPTDGRCMRITAAATPPKPAPAAPSANRCGPGFTDIGGGCLANALVKRN